MAQPLRDDAPSAFSLARRKFLDSGILLTASSVAAPHLLADSPGV
jgi:hypothetical protein